MTDGEFGLIGHIVDVLDDAARGPDVAVGPGDDAAVLCVPAGRQLVVSTDTLVSGRHYPEGAAPDLVGYRSMAAAVSDLAAMGADPAWATVSLTAPELAPSSAKLFADRVRRGRAAIRNQDRRRQLGERPAERDRDGAWPRASGHRTGAQRRPGRRPHLRDRRAWRRGVGA